MRIKMILGILAIICGIILFAVSGYITHQVALGRDEIRSGQEKVHAGQTKVNDAQKQVNDAQTKVNIANQVIDNTSRVGGLGGLVTSPVQEKINSGQAQINAGQAKINAGQKKIKAGIQEADYYAKLANQLKIGGIAFIVVGAILLLLCIRKKKFMN